MGKGTYGSQVGRPKKKKMGMNPGGMAKKPMNEGMKALKKAAPEVAKRMGFNYGSMVKKKMGMMGGGMSKKMGYNKGTLMSCGASNPAERPMKKMKK